MRRLTLNPKVKGIIAILISAVGFSFMSVFRLAGDLPVFQKSLARILLQCSYHYSSYLNISNLCLGN